MRPTPKKEDIAVHERYNCFDDSRCTKSENDINSDLEEVFENTDNDQDDEES